MVLSRPHRGLLLNRINRHAYPQAVARVAAHERCVVLTPVVIGHVIAGDTRLRVIHGAAALDLPLHVLVLAIVVLATLIPVLELVTSDGAQHRAQRGSGVLATAPADLMPQDAAGQAAHNSAPILMILTLATAVAASFIDPMAAAFVARDIDVFVLWLGAANTRVVGVGLGVGAEQSGGQQTGDDKTFHEKLLGLVWNAVCACLCEPRLNRYEKVCTSQTRAAQTESRSVSENQGPHPPRAPTHPVMSTSTRSSTRRPASKNARAARPAEPRLSRTRRPPELEVADWQTALRRQFGREQHFGLENLGQEPVFSDFRVSNPASGTHYRVAIRGQVPGH